MTGGPAGSARRPAWPWLLAALALLAAAVALLWTIDLVPPPPSAPSSPAGPVSRWATGPARVGTDAPAAATAAEAPAPAPVPASPAPAAPRSSGATATAPAAPDDLAAHVPPGTVPTMNQVIEQLHQRGIRTGLGAFNPPGTKPPLVGLAVPEGFELPPGYVRHQQATDDGQAIEPILMFDPDQPPPAAAGRPLSTPAERVVPPELAPPGLVLRRIVLPTPLPTLPPSPWPSDGSAPD